MTLSRFDSLTSRVRLWTFFLFSPRVTKLATYNAKVVQISRLIGQLQKQENLKIGNV